MIRVLQKKHIGLALLPLAAATSFAQKAECGFIRKRNRFFNDDAYVNAEVNYRKALEVNPQSTVPMSNLGNTLAQQDRLQEAMEQYVAAAKVEKDKDDLTQIYRNMGVISQSQRGYAKAVGACKQSLCNNPKGDETHYNLALTQEMLKDQQQDQQNQDQNQQQRKQDQQEDKEGQSKGQQQNKEQQQPPQPQKRDNEMSKENTEQLLSSVMQDEEDIRDKVRK